MAPRWQIKDEAILVNGKRVRLNGAVGEAVEHEGTIVVRMKTSDGSTYGHANVVGVGVAGTGQIHWTIKPNLQQGRPNPVVGITLVDGKVRMFFGNGGYAELDSASGGYQIPKNDRS